MKCCRSRNSTVHGSLGDIYEAYLTITKRYSLFAVAILEHHDVLVYSSDFDNTLSRAERSTV
jgi:hypothetical protein